jgi:hypothetical protein
MNRNISKENVSEKVFFYAIKQETISLENDDEETPRYNMISVKKQKTN